ncbi:kinesin-like protein KIF12 isoform X10 [Lepidochelys kempii]|uniref:kinesin-like protein KIF12 isoform X10 n=1 Tax=Lepidochelys kempii TaxID=8472 RepID=UPI003C6FA586
MSPKPERLHGPVSQPPAPPQLLGLPESLLPTLVVFPRSPAGEQEDSMDRKETCLRVVVRVRPLTCQELRRGDQRVVHCLGDNTIYVNAAGQEAAFRASAAFDAGTSQEGLFEGSGMKRLIELAANGQLQLSASTRLRAQAPSSTHSPGTTRSTLLTPARAHSRAPLPLRVISAPPCAQLSDHSAGLHSLAPPRGGALHPPRKGAGAQRLFAPSPRFSCTAFAFGQTGSGKTYSLMGPLAQSEGQPVTPYLMGLMQRAFVCLLEQTQCYRPGLVLSASYVEIHNEQPFLLTHVLLAFWAPFPPAPAPLLCPGERPAEPRATQAPARAMEQNQGLLHREPADRGVWEPGGHHGPAAGRHPTAAERCARAEWALEPQPRPADHPHPPQGSKPRPQLLPARRALLRGPGRQREGEGHRLSWGALSGGQQHQPQSPGSGALHLSAGGPQTEAKSHPVQGQQAHPAAGGVPGRIWDHAHGCLHLPLLALPPGDTAHAALCKQGQEGHHQACGTQGLPGEAAAKFGARNPGPAGGKPLPAPAAASAQDTGRKPSHPHNPHPAARVPGRELCPRAERGPKKSTRLSQAQPLWPPTGLCAGERAAQVAAGRSPSWADPWETQLLAAGASPGPPSSPDVRAPGAPSGLQQLGPRQTLPRSHPWLLHHPGPNLPPPCPRRSPVRPHAGSCPHLPLPLLLCCPASPRHPLPALPAAEGAAPMGGARCREQFQVPGGWAGQCVGGPGSALAPAAPCGSLATPWEKGPAPKEELHCLVSAPGRHPAAGP